MYNENGQLRNLSSRETGLYLLPACSSTLSVTA